MKKGYLRKILFLIFLFSFFNISFIKGQDDSLSVEEIEKVLTLEPSIQGLHYQLEVKIPKSQLGQIDFDEMNFLKVGDILFSDTLISYGKTLELKSLLETKYNLDPFLKYFIFDLVSDRESVNAYLSNLEEMRFLFPELK